ncbi:Zinc finger and SCAN domain containing protein 29 [Dissostichus eleginoides]|uniref:Zinc finger and SCAN domain containing protein 29 n=1 Tax=Dissostichus eleginoides TaxID=100907 RepID=A0AAD9ETC9_DISEL|nr:Zinc finger and SCAN domain containing protein 29 [Dissostichus eleginoides]
MEGHLQGGCRDIVILHVKTEAVDENTSALVLSSRGSPAPCGDSACRGGEQTAEEPGENTAAPGLLYPVSTDRFFTTSGDGKTYLKIAPDPVSTDRFFTTSGDGKTYLKIAPASAMPPSPSEKTLLSGSDFSSKAVLCLIEAVGRRWGLYETRERSQLFQSVQEEMASKGHLLPVEKIRRKWNNLIVTYKRVKDRSQETGHAKTSWEFFDLMDATLCDTVGTQVINNKRNKSGNAVSTLPGPLAKIAAKPEAAPPTIIQPNGDFASSGGVDSVGQGAISGQLISTAAAMPSMTTVSPPNAPELKPLIISDIVTTSIHPATIVPSPSFISSPCFTETASPSPSLLSSTSNTDHNTSRYVGRKAPSFSSGVVPFRLSNAPLCNTQNLLSLSSSFPPTSSSLTPSISHATTMSVSKGQSQKGNEEPSSATLSQEILQRQEEQSYLDRVAGRRVEAREKRRERREVRMAGSLGRIATALELLSSKQDTVIALLQRLADRK